MQTSYYARVPARIAVMFLFACVLGVAQTQNVGAVGRGVSISFQNATGSAERGVSVGFRDAAGTIQVTTNVATATYTISGPATYTGSGQSFTQSNAPAGAYTIKYGAAPGFTAPASETQTLSAGGSITFGRTYTALAGIGRIQVITNLSAASFTVGVLTTTPGFTPFSGSGKAYDTGVTVPSGTYQINFAPVQGYFSPPSQTMTLGAGGTLQFTGNYRRIIVVLFTGFTNHPVVPDSADGVTYPDVCSVGDCPGMAQLSMEIRTDPRLRGAVLTKTFTYYDVADYGNYLLSNACVVSNICAWWHVPSDSTRHTVATAWLQGTARPGPDDRIVVIGHSYGGNRARLFAEQLPNYGLSVDLLVTVDPIDFATCDLDTGLAGACNQDGDSYVKTKQASIGDLLAFAQLDSTEIRGYHFASYPYARMGNYGCPSIESYCSHVAISTDPVVHNSILDRLALLQASPTDAIYATSVTSIGTTAVTITWKTASTTSGGVIYSQNPDASTSSIESLESTGAGIIHSATISGLVANTRYYFKIRAKIPGSANSQFSSIGFFQTSQANAPILKASSPVLTRTASGTALSVIIKNSGASATNGTVTAASIGATKTTVALPLPVPDLAPGGSFNPVIPFPSSIGATGSTVYPTLTFKYSGSTFSIAVPPVTVP